MRAACEGSLQRLGIDHIDLYYQHRVDPTRRSRRRSARWRELVARARSATSASRRPRAETIRRAHAVHPITAVQTEYSLWTRDVESEILPTMRELGIGLVAYSPLGRGFLSGRFTSPDELDEGDFRRYGPRFTGENLEHNLRDRAARAASSPTSRASPPASSRSPGCSTGAGHRADPGHQAASPTSRRTSPQPVELSGRGGAHRRGAAVRGRYARGDAIVYSRSSVPSIARRRPRPYLIRPRRR